MNIAVGDVSTRVSEKGDVGEDEDLKTKGKKMIEQLAWYARALKDAKLKKEVPC